MSGRSGIKCSIVIRSYNEEKHIGRLLAGIAQQTIKDAEVILVDSGSTDATVAIASRFPVKILNIDPEDFSFGRSLNLGCAKAAGVYLVIVSAHVYPLYTDWLEKLLAPFQDPQVALVYGKQCGDHRSKFSERQILASWFPNQSVQRQGHPFCNNANAAIRRELWEIRPYNETLPALEDIDWATWVMSQGYDVSYSSEAEIIHVHNEPPRDVYNRYRREAMAMKKIRPEEHFHFWDFLRLYASNGLSDCRFAFAGKALRRELWRILWFRFMQFWGTYRGFAIAGPLTSQLKYTFYYPRARATDMSEMDHARSKVDYGLRTHERKARQVDGE